MNCPTCHQPMDRLPSGYVCLVCNGRIHPATGKHEKPAAMPTVTLPVATVRKAYEGYRLFQRQAWEIKGHDGPFVECKSPSDKTIEAQARIRKSTATMRVWRRVWLERIEGVTWEKQGATK